MSTTRRLQKPKAWIFQANPARYAIFKTLATQRVERWNLRQHAKDVRAGERAYIWVAGEHAGIYAVGTVLTAPEVMTDSPIGVQCWTDPQEGRRPIARAEVRYDRVILERPLLKQYLRNDPVLRDLTILRAPRRTNFGLTDQEALAIEEWLADQPEQSTG